MVKKLLKYEIKYYLKTLIVMLPITIIMGIGTLILTPLKDIDSPVSLFYYLSIVILTFTTVVTVFAPLILNIVRFYKNLYTNEGYLTFSLPVSNHEHIISKIIAGVIFQIIAVIVAILAIIIAFSPIQSFWHFIGDFFISIKNIFAFLSPVHAILYGIEFLIIGILSVFTAPLLYYSCISIGQLGKKNRILLAVLVYYGYTVIAQILLSIITVILTIFGLNGLFDSIITFMANSPYLAVHIMLIIIIIVEAGLGLLFYLINYKIMTNKLNLE